MSHSDSIFLFSNTSWYLYNFRRGTILAMVANGYRVVCCSPEDDYSQRLVGELGAEFVALQLDGKSTSVFSEVKTLASIAAILRRNRPAMVFNFTIKMNLYCGLVCRLLRLRYANNISGLGTAFLHDSLLFRFVRKVYGLANQGAQTVFFQNEDDLSVFRSMRLLKGAPVTLLPGSGVDLERFAWKPMAIGGERCFLMVARLLGDKGVREYAQACRILRDSGVRARFVLLGPLGVSNRTAISENEVAGWVAEGVLEYPGSADDVRPWLEAAHVLVLPSYREGMPRTVLEAAAAGRPAIVTDVPGCRQAVEPEVTGWLCLPKDAGSLAACMRRVSEMSDAELQNAGACARERMEVLFSEQRVVDAYLQSI